MKRFGASLRCAVCGLRHMINSQRNARFHLAATVVVCVMGITFGIALWEWACIFLIVAIVWALEAMNTAIECLADRVTRETDTQIKLAKDVAAGAVLISAGAAFTIGLVIFLPHLYHWALPYLH